MTESQNSVSTAQDEANPEIGRFFLGCGWVLLAAVLYITGRTGWERLYTDVFWANVGVTLACLIPIALILWVVLLVGYGVFVKLPSRSVLRTAFLWALLLALIVIMVPLNPYLPIDEIRNMTTRDGITIGVAFMILIGVFAAGCRGFPHRPVR
jgi:hypothetical protein